MKYIIFGLPDDVPTIVIFDCITSHSTIRNKMDMPIISAGKISVGWNCVSGSVTLCIPFDAKQSADDTATIKRAIDLSA